MNSPLSTVLSICRASAAPPSKSQSLPAHASIKQLDAVILSALRVPADVLANQITLLDFPVFAQIQPDELSSCAWTKKDKHVNTPNIVAFTKRFNHTSFWTVQEILNAEQPKQRAEIITHFIKVSRLEPPNHMSVHILIECFPFRWPKNSMSSTICTRCLPLFRPCKAPAYIA